MIKIKWEMKWKMGKENARWLYNMSQYLDIIIEFKLYKKLKWKQVILLFRLHIEHCHLNQYLHQFNIIEISEYEYDEEKEIIEYYLLNYELYDEERDILRRRIEV